MSREEIRGKISKVKEILNIDNPTLVSLLLILYVNDTENKWKTDEVREIINELQNSEETEKQEANNENFIDCFTKPIEKYMALNLHNQKCNCTEEIKEKTPIREDKQIKVARINGGFVTNSIIVEALNINAEAIIDIADEIIKIKKILKEQKGE